MSRVLLLLIVLASGCASLRPVDGRPRLMMPRVCPDGGPVKFLQHPSCGRECGYSCLPDRWQTPAAARE
jgi:hypothetical protein